jgi:crossover junction endodeoxyribonuclease RusA
MELILPYPPSINHYKNIGRTIRTKNGKSYQARVNSPETKAFYYEVWLKIRSLKATKLIIDPIETLLSVTLCVYPPDKRKRDLDGILKVLLDSLQRGGLIKDDYQICRLVIERCAIIPQGQVVVRIEELP